MKTLRSLLILLALATLTCALATQAQAQNKEREKLKHESVSLLPLTGFGSIKADIPVRIAVKPGTTYEVRLATKYLGLNEAVSFSVNADTLIVTAPPAIREEMKAYKNASGLSVTLTMPNINAVQLVNGAQLEILDHMQSAGFSLVVDAPLDDCKIEGKSIMSSGAISIKLDGQVQLSLGKLRGTSMDIKLNTTERVKLGDVTLSAACNLYNKGKGDLSLGNLETSDLAIAALSRGSIAIGDIKQTGNVSIDAQVKAGVTLGNLRAQALSVVSRSDADINCKGLSAPSIKIELSAKGSFKASGDGVADLISVNSSAKGDFIAPKVQASNVEIELPGGANAELWALQNLKVGSAGKGSKIGYKGTPQISVSKDAKATLKPL